MRINEEIIAINKILVRSRTSSNCATVRQNGIDTFLVDAKQAYLSLTCERTYKLDIERSTPTRGFKPRTFWLANAFPQFFANYSKLLYKPVL